MSLMMNELADYKTIEPYKLSVAHGFVFKFYLKVYEKLANKLVIRILFNKVIQNKASNQELLLILRKNFDVLIFQYFHMG